ncbi:MAG: hypothetical protein HY847_19060 [Betaproteobacteria bacterium]|nr:hypothetical protein [Betaproteobacteria bacterium]
MKISLCRLAATTGLCAVICIAKAQGIGSAGMSPPLNQIEAIESHLQHSRTQSKREVDELASKNPKPHEIAKPASNSPVTKKKKPDAEGEKPKSSNAPAVK